MAIKRSIYDAARRIVDEKGKWHTAKSKNEDVTPYANAATPFYKELEDGGAGDIAEKLRNSDYTQALSYLNTLEVEEEPKTYEQQYREAWESAQGKSDKTYATIEADKSGLAKDYDDAIAYLKQGYTGTDYYKALRDRYDALGEDAVLGELAATGAENSGNIDSYAKAQAQRQQLAYANAGESAALDQYNAIVGKYLAGLDSKAGMSSDAWQKLIDVSQGDQSIALNMYNSLLAADTEEEVARQNALAAQYEAQTSPFNQLQNAMSDWVLEYTKENGSGPSEEDYNSVFAQMAKIYGLPVVGEQSSEAPEDDADTESDTEERPEPEYIDWAFIIAKMNSLPADQREGYINSLVDEGKIGSWNAKRLYDAYKLGENGTSGGVTVPGAGGTLTLN